MVDKNGVWPRKKSKLHPAFSAMFAPKDSLSSVKCCALPSRSSRSARLCPTTCPVARKMGFHTSGNTQFGGWIAGFIRLRYHVEFGSAATIPMPAFAAMASAVAARVR